MFPFPLGLYMGLNGARHPPCNHGLTTWDTEPYVLPTQWPNGFPCNGVTPATSLHCPFGLWPQLGLAELDEAPRS